MRIVLVIFYRHRLVVNCLPVTGLSLVYFMSRDNLLSSDWSNIVSVRLPVARVVHGFFENISDQQKYKLGKKPVSIVI